jgi:hypothetical protein
MDIINNLRGGFISNIPSIDYKIIVTHIGSNSYSVNYHHVKAQQITKGIINNMFVEHTQRRFLSANSVQTIKNIAL